jgi:hypothetical protein
VILGEYRADGLGTVLAVLWGRRLNMSRLLLTVAAAVALVLPEAHRADDWGEDQYDVSVDLNVQGAGVGFETFRSPLQPYGDWVVVGSYGQVWRPRVATGWRPYYYGRWEWTNEGWLWASDEPWGWAAYHYGRWAYDPYYGWVWVPGNEWAPAWVSWRVSGDVVGWAPLAPGFSAYVTAYPFVDFWWTFVPSGRFCSIPVHSVAYAPNYSRRWYDATAPAPAFVSRPGPVRGGHATPAWGGPAPQLIERHVGRPLSPVRIVGAPSPGFRARPGEIAVYRPERGFRDGGRPADRVGAPAPAAPGFVGRGGGEFRPGARAPEYRAPPATRAPEYRGPPATRAPEYRAPEHRAPDAGHATPPARGGFGGGQGGDHRAGARAWAPPAGGASSGGGWSAPPSAPSRGGGAPPSAPPAGGGGGGGAVQRGGGHGRGDRH